MGEKILVVEDDADIRELLVYNLQSEGFDVYDAATGSSGISLIKKEEPDLILLDVMLPNFSGLDIFRNMQRGSSWGEIPVIIVTAKGEEIDRIVGFELGADDYVVKPFSVREVILRVKAVLGRKRRRERDKTEHNRLEVGPIVIDPGRHEVYVDGRQCVLSAKEFSILHRLATKPGKFQRREMLLSEIWGDDAYVTPRTIDTNVRRLRRKLGPASKMIETLRGTGYRLSDGASNQVP